MISTYKMFLEGSSNSMKDIISDFVQEASVKRFLDLSKKQLNGELSSDESKELGNLFKDPKVKAYLEAAAKVGQREGWIKGGAYGGIIGLIGGGIAAASAPPIVIAAAAIAGAASVGAGLGFLASKAYSILRRWDAEDRIAIDGPRGIRVHV